MRWSTFPPLVVAVGLLIGAASQYPDSPAAYALGSAGLIVLGCWLTLEIGSEWVSRWRKQTDPPDGPK